MISKKKLILLKILTLFYITNITNQSIFDISLQDIFENHSAIKEKIYGPPRDCVTGLASSYGLQELSRPTKMVMDMCPGIQYSCCKKKSQIEIYQNWYLSKEETNMEKKFIYFKRIYYKLLTSLLLAKKRIDILLKRVQFEKQGNCKILAQKLNGFKIEDTVPKLKEDIDNMYDFFYQSYEGFYCTICDATQNIFIDTILKKVKLENMFCRQISENSLTVLLYFHVNLSTYFNLLAKFLNSCDYKGRFTDSNLSPDYQFRMNMEVYEMLESCKSNRNGPEWFKYCSPICNKFHPLKINNFFHPFLKKYQKFNEFIHHRLSVINTQEKDNAVLQPIKIVTDAPKTKLQKKKEHLLYKKNTGKYIIKSGAGEMTLDDYSILYCENENDDCINFFKNGAQSDLTEKNYKTILFFKKKSIIKKFGNVFRRLLGIKKEDGFDGVGVIRGLAFLLFVLF